jgi:hypothetical protein
MWLVTAWRALTRHHMARDEPSPQVSTPPEPDRLPAGEIELLEGQQKQAEQENSKHNAVLARLRMRRR